jgi:hypothetical protein
LIQRAAKYYHYRALKAHAAQNWPHPIPARVRDGGNKDLMVMTLGAVSPSIADGTFDPVKDEMRLRDGAILKNYFRDTLKIKYFHPIDKTHFPSPPSGWCSWYFFYQEINENEIQLTAKWIAENLKDYGVQYVQIDDGWQGTGHGLGENRDWSTINNRFPGGMDGLARYIKSLGLKPGIWLAPHGQSNASVVKSHPGVFMTKQDGTSASSTWEGTYLVDPSAPEAQTYLKNLFTKLSGWGYEYFKIDGQPIVVREYRTKKEFMKSQAIDSDELYRGTLESIREAIGPDRYLLGCWVIPLEGVGLMNGSRIGADVLPNWDGFKFAMRATMQYYFLHNVAWYADPDVFYRSSAAIARTSACVGHVAGVNRPGCVDERSFGRSVAGAAGAGEASLSGRRHSSARSVLVGSKQANLGSEDQPSRTRVRRPSAFSTSTRVRRRRCS